MTAGADAPEAPRRDLRPERAIDGAIARQFARAASSATESAPIRRPSAAYAARVLRLYDTASGEVRELAQRRPGQVDIYLCGPTVYGPPHLGHGRATLAYDVLRRYLEWSGVHVRLVSNITDIDDKIIARANREGRDAEEIARRCEAVWFRAMAGIGVDPPTDIPHATEYVDQMVAMIGELIEIGRAYPTEDGVYLDVTSVEDYGLLAHQSLDQMLAGGGEREVYGAELKHHPADFALWKAAKPDEPSWPSPWGDGRPGWHTECVVMSLDLLGEGFDLHCGGLDLKFPHHENERAQAVALGRRFANHWMHHAFVVDESGEKMSKSVGNIENLLDLIEKVDGRAFRMVLLQAHYRSPVQVGPERLEAASRALGRIDALARRTAALPDAEPDPTTLAAFSARMDDDLDTPGAMAVVFDSVSSANSLLDSGDEGAAAPLVAAVWSMCTAVGLVPRAEDEVPDDIAQQVAALDAARAERDFSVADTLRAALQDEGWVVETTKDGTRVHRA
jgi:cysteinyl-tRNA synthetase